MVEWRGAVHRNAAFRSGDTGALNAVRRNLEAGIKRAKAEYALKIQRHFSINDPQSMWKDIKNHH